MVIKFTDWLSEFLEGKTSLDESAIAVIKKKMSGVDQPLNKDSVVACFLDFVKRYNLPLGRETETHFYESSFAEVLKTASNCNNATLHCIENQRVATLKGEIAYHFSEYILILFNDDSESFRFKVFLGVSDLLAFDTPLAEN